MLTQTAATARTRRPTVERDALIRTHIDVAHRISAKMARRCPQWVSRDDLASAAMLGLTEAAERYDVTRAEPFLGFAEKRIRGAVLDELRRGDMMPRRVRARARTVGSTIAKLEQQLGRTPSDEEVAAALGVDLETYRAELEQLVHVTVGAFEGELESIADSDGNTIEAQADRSRAMTRVRAALEKLDRRDALILALYYTEELSYTEIGEVLSVSPSRVCQLHGRAIARLRAEITG